MAFSLCGYAAHLGFAAGGIHGVIDNGAEPLALPVRYGAASLAANALKRGALRAGGPRVHRLRYRPGLRRSFGLRLIGRGQAIQAGMAADLRFEPERLRCTPRLPPFRLTSTSVGSGNRLVSSAPPEYEPSPMWSRSR
jgi:hypothetical protein